MTENYYDSDRGLSEYLLFHYGAADTRFPVAMAEAFDFPARCVRDGLAGISLHSPSRALDLGCAVGRSTFELARVCDEVIGIDFSQAFITAAQRLGEEGSISFSPMEEGDLKTLCQAAVPHGIERGRVTFEQGDASHLRKGLGKFHVILAANLIDRLVDPLACLKQLAGLLHRGGQLILTSPYTWMEQYTPRANWLGGLSREDKAVHTTEALLEILSPNFDLRLREDWPFILREHARKFQLGLAEATVWTRR